MLPETRKKLGEVLAQRSDTSQKEIVDKVEEFLLIGEAQHFYSLNSEEF